MPRRRFQEGCRRVINGKWVLWFYRDELRNGEIVRVKVSERICKVGEISDRELEKRIAAILQKVNDQSEPLVRQSRDCITLEHFIPQWRENAAHELAASTRKGIESNLRAHIIPVLGKVPLRELTVLKYQELINSMMDTTARGTRRNIIADLQSILNAARVWHKDITIPTVVRKELYFGKKKAGEGRPAAHFSIAQAVAVLQELEHRRPWNVFFPLLALSALRSTEILGLYVEDLDFEANLIHIRRGAWNGKIQQLKTPESESDLPLPPQVKEMLREYLKDHKHQVLFANKCGGPYKREYVVTKILHRTLDRLGIPRKGKRVGLHAFRHTMASWLLKEKGVLIAQRQLRHKSPSVTLKNYGHILGDDHTDSITEAESVFLPTNGTKQYFPNS